MHRPRITSKRTQPEKDSLKRLVHFDHDSVVKIFDVDILYNYYNQSSQCHRSSNSLCNEPLNRVTLHRFTSQSEKMDSAQLTRESLAHSFCQEVFSSTLTSHAKREAFNQLWPHIMARMVHRTLKNFADLNQQMKELLDSL